MNITKLRKVLQEKIWLLNELKGILCRHTSAAKSKLCSCHQQPMTEQQQIGVKTYRHRVEKYCHQYKQYDNYKESYNLASEAAPQNVPQAFKRWRKPPKGGRGSTVMWKQKCKILIYTVASSASVTWGVSMIIGSSNKDDGNDDAMIWLVQWEKKSCATHFSKILWNFRI